MCMARGQRDEKGVGQVCVDTNSDVSILFSSPKLGKIPVPSKSICDFTRKLLEWGPLNILLSLKYLYNFIRALVQIPQQLLQAVKRNCTAFWIKQSLFLAFLIVAKPP